MDRAAYRHPARTANELSNGESSGSIKDPCSKSCEGLCCRTPLFIGLNAASCSHFSKVEVVLTYVGFVFTRTRINFGCEVSYRGLKMQKSSKWAVCAGLSAIALMGLAGCNKGEDSGADNAVSPSIQSPVMNKADDQAIAGSDGSASNSTANSSAMSGAGGAGAGDKMSGAGGGSAVPAPNTAKQ